MKPGYAQEVMLRVSWSCLSHADGQAQHVRRGEVMLDLGIETAPDPEFTREEMQSIAFAAKIAALKALRARPRKKTMTRKEAQTEAHRRWGTAGSEAGDRYGVVELRRKNVLNRCVVGYHVRGAGPLAPVTVCVMAEAPTWEEAFATANRMPQPGACPDALRARHTSRVTAETIMDWQIEESGASAEDIRAAQGQEPPTHEARYRWQRARARAAPRLGMHGRDREGHEGVSNRRCAVPAQVFQRQPPVRTAGVRVRAAALTLGRRLGLPAEPRLVDAVLDDDTFMRGHAGEVPARVCEAVHAQARRLAHRAGGQ